MTRRIMALLALAISGWLLLVNPMAQAGPGDATATGSASGDATPSAESSGGNSTAPDTGTANPGTSIAAGSGKAVPRLMLVAFATDPATITAGSGFDVNLSLENKSKTERVSNIKVTAAAEGDGILPAGSSASAYIDRIGAGGVAHRTIPFRTLASLEGRAYQMTITVEYEDSEHNMLTTTETVSVVVAQTNRASTSIPRMSPSELMVGMEGSLTFTVNNLGKNKLFNTTVAIAEGQAVQPAQVFVGNIEPGASGNVELTVTPIEEYSGPVALTITYEDANGEAASMDASFELLALPASAFEVPMEEEPIVEEEPGFPWWMIAGIVFGVLALVVLIVVLVRRRNKANSLEEDMSFLDGDTLVNPR